MNIVFASFANIEDDMGDGTPGNPGKRNDFEMAVAYLLPKDPVTNKVAKGPNKRGVSKISDLIQPYSPRLF